MLLWLFFLLTIVSASTKVYDFNITYVDANPDGVHERTVIGINGEWPVPTIRVKRNDRVIINVDNQLSENTSLHFHGLFQNGTNSMDGPQMVTQCPIPPGYQFTYNFTVDQVGTYWYHSHTGNQYGDGLRGFFIIEDDEPPFKYDEELTISVGDWYHKESGELMKKFLSRYNPTGAEPIPQNSLFNDSKNVTMEVKPDTTYFLRIVNMGLFTSQYLKLEHHTFTIVEIDGVYVEPTESESLLVGVAQRYGVLVTTKKSSSKNYRFINIIDRDMLDVLPPDLQLISTNYFVYDKSATLPEAYKGNSEKKYDEIVENLKIFDDFDLIPLSKEPLYDEPDYIISLDFQMDNLGDGVNYAFFNNISYTPPKVPTLYSVMSSGKYGSNVGIYGSNTNSFVIQSGEIVEIIVNNQDPGKHPFHLHGHTFQVIYRSEEGEDDDPIVYDPNNPEHDKLPEIPVSRDTVLVNPNGFVRLRFKADNPGVWFFHCHVDWHLEQGLAITLIESPEEIQKQTVPSNHFDACKPGNISTTGNAAGRTGKLEDWLDLTGEFLQPPPLPEGFTSKGYFAFLICTLVALYGLVTIYQYGMEDIKTVDNEEIMTRLNKLLNDHGALNEEGISLSSNLEENSI